MLFATPHTDFSMKVLAPVSIVNLRRNLNVMSEEGNTPLIRTGSVHAE
jgi:hypothetical protein